MSAANRQLKPPKEPPSGGTDPSVTVLPKAANDVGQKNFDRQGADPKPVQPVYAPVPWPVQIAVAVAAISILFVLFNAPEWIRGANTSPYMTGLAVLGGISLLMLLRPMNPVWAFVRGILFLDLMLVSGVLASLFGPEKIDGEVLGFKITFEIVRPGTVSADLIIVLAILLAFLNLLLAIVVLAAKWMDIRADRR